MKILIVSDTHGMDARIEQVIEIERPFDRLIHLGDICGSDDYIAALADVPCDIVAGNNDLFTTLPSELITVLGGHKALLTHGHYYDLYGDALDLANKARDMGCDIAMHGHTHVPYVRWENGVMLLNPGSLTYPRQVGRKPSYIIMNIDDTGKIDCDIKYH